MSSLVLALVLLQPPKDEPTYKRLDFPTFPDADAAFSADGKQIAVGGGGTLRVLTLPDGREVVRMQPPDKNTLYFAFCADGKHLVSACLEDRTIRFWSLATGKQTRDVIMPRAADVQWVVGFSPDGRRLALRDKTGICLVDPETGKVAADLPGAGPGERSFQTRGGAFSNDGKKFAAGFGNGRLAVWESATGKRLVLGEKKYDKTFAGQFCYLAFSPDDKWIAAGNGGIIGQPIEIWDAATGEFLAAPIKTQGYGVTVGWTPDGTSVIYTDYPGVRAINVATERVTHVFHDGLWGAVLGPSPDGRHVAFYRWNRPNDVALFSAPPFAKPGPPKAELTAAELDALWADLAIENKIRRARIAAATSAAAKSWVPHVLKTVKPATAGDVGKLRKLIADLASDSPDAQKAALSGLAASAHRYEPLLEKAFAEAESRDVKNRLAALLNDVEKTPAPADVRAELRAIETLAKLNTPEAVRALDVLADRAPESRVTQAARAALKK